MKKLQLFDQNHGLSPLQKCQFCGFLKPMFSLFRKACLLYKTSKIVFHYLFSRSMTWEYRKRSFTIFQNAKTSFQVIKTRSSKSRKIDIFHGVGSMCLSRRIPRFIVVFSSGHRWLFFVASLWAYVLVASFLCLCVVGPSFR